jgi:LysR family hydrogen peroxide-inducible transcriptional activator
MELHQLRYFLAVARTGSFTRAAEREGVAQPTLSQQIRKLERELGLPLFERLGRGVRLTPAGQRLLGHAQAVLRELTEARHALQAFRDQVAGALTVGVIPTILPYFLAGRLEQFLRRHPAVEVQVVEEVTDRLLEKLTAGDLDLAIVRLPVRRPHLVCSEILREPLLAALPPGHRLGAQPEVDPRDLESERLLVLRDGHCLRSQVLALCRRSASRPQDVLETDQLASITALVASGFGVSVLPAMAAEAAGGCLLRRISGRAWRRVGYVRLPRRFVPPAQAAFTQWLKEIGREFSRRLAETWDQTRPLERREAQGLAVRGES